MPVTSLSYEESGEKGSHLGFLKLPTFLKAEAPLARSWEREDQLRAFQLSHLFASWGQHLSAPPRALTGSQSETSGPGPGLAFLSSRPATRKWLFWRRRAGGWSLRHSGLRLQLLLHSDSCGDCGESVTGSEGNRTNGFCAGLRKPGPRRGRSRGEAGSSLPGRCGVWDFSGVTS